ncbi:MAG TPA: cory-CC-star protein [Longimicrobiales bacterium]|nr:cory-CC-star protein [Longimicrobiales bacterium]
MSRARATPGRVLRALHALRDIYEGIFLAPYRSALLREERRQNDLFLLLVLPELLGVPNPVAFYTLELYPEVIGQYHQWHQRMGLERAPEGGFRCC